MRIRTQEELLDRNFGLTESEFFALRDQLRHGDDSLYQRVFLTHFEECLQYLRNQYEVEHAMAYDATMDALLLFCHRLRAGKVQYGNLRFLFTQMAGQQLMRERSEGRRWLDLEEAPIDELMDVDDDTQRAMQEAFDQSWPRLGGSCRELLANYFYHKVTLREIADEAGRSEVAIRKQKQRCMDKLRTLFGTVYQP